MPGRLEPFSTMSVLIVDDNEANVALLRALLEREGVHRIAVETDPRRVAGRLAGIDPDLVLLDLHMPHLDGHAVLAQIVRFAAGTYLPVMVLTADTGVRERDRALSQGARDFLTKPLDLAEFSLRAANLLETRQLYASIRGTTNGLPLEPRHVEAELPRIRDGVESVLRERSITPVYQRVVDVSTLATVGYEALARFPTQHEHGPSGWFSDAFAVGRGVELEWLAVMQALPFLDECADGFLALNMSPATVLGLPADVLCDTIPGSRLVIELTEHVPIEDYAALGRALRGLRDCGVRLAADDVGAGYAGFRHLVALEPDIIKLDISLVSGIDRSRGQRALARALVAFSVDVGAVVIAEGVETLAELDTLRELGVPWAQGYHLGRPEPRAGVST
jgi:EAL domain-containing protein (putative c-di-GMP-specific phosphodiesterase class I)/CheY-like chemotaxis protein